MGFFSWKTQDTNKSIPNKYSNRKTFRVYMIDNKGNRWIEDDYEGYGRFGGKDFYELLAEMNGITSNLKGQAYTDYMRGKGIDLAFKNNPSGVATKGVFFPNLILDADQWSYEKSGPDSDENQGYFYDDDEDEEYDNDNDYDEDEEYEYAKGGIIVDKKIFDINDDEVSEDIYEWLLDYTPEDFELSEEDQYAIRLEDPERVIDFMNDALTDYEIVTEYDDDIIRLKIINKTNMENGGYMAKGGSNHFYENLQVHVQGVGTIYHGKSMKAAISKAKTYLSKNPKAEIVIVDEKYGDEYDLEGNQVEYKYGGYMAKGGMMNDEKMTLKLKKEFEGKDLFDDEIVDEYVVKQFDYSEDDDKIEKFIRMKKNKFYVVPFDNQDDSYYYILVPKDKMADGGYMAKGGKIEKALYNIDKWMPEDFELQREYYQLINDKDQKGMEEFLDMYADKDRLMRYGIQYEDLGKLAEAIISGSNYAKGGKLKSNPAKFRDKVKAISKKLVGTKVPKKYKKDYGATYDKQEANTAARRISGAKLAELKEKLAKKTKTKKK